MISIIDGGRIESKVTDRISYAYTVELNHIFRMEVVVFQNQTTKDIIVILPARFSILDHKLYKDMRLMLERRFLRDIATTK